MCVSLHGMYTILCGLMTYDSFISTQYSTTQYSIHPMNQEGTHTTQYRIHPMKGHIHVCVLTEPHYHAQLVDFAMENQKRSVLSPSVIHNISGCKSETKSQIFPPTLSCITFRFSKSICKKLSLETDPNVENTLIKKQGSQNTTRELIPANLYFTTGWRRPLGCLIFIGHFRKTAL